MELNLSGILHIILIFQGISISLFLFLTNKGKSSVNVVLGSLLMVLSGHMTLNLLEGILGAYGVTKLNNVLGFLYGPLIWIYIQRIINKRDDFGAINALIFIPFVASVIVQFSFNFKYFGPIILIQTLIFLVISLIEVRNHEEIVKQTSSYSHSISLKWLYQFIGGALILLLFDMARNVVSLTGPMVSNAYLYNMLLGIIILMIHVLVFKSLDHSSKFSGISEKDRVYRDKKNKAHGLKLSREEIRSLAYRAENFLLESGIYQRAELTLREFSKEFNENPRIVSHVINYYYNTNFSDWINSQRLNYAIEQLKNHGSKEKNISEILYESGFNSTSSFYKAFSNKLGMTPKEYRNKFGSYN